ncbi:TM2 domain-containing protein 3-like [Protopterus annectens]|uniref:TM2 domain-containing protein 3-like n=1 Tax=Protopterus annectens TaxID=7888 RepID=UPI001CFA7068|nr:TM2 domain-containing protein 3-like [Protopterus annectens]
MGLVYMLKRYVRTVLLVSYLCVLSGFGSQSLETVERNSQPVKGQMPSYTSTPAHQTAVQVTEIPGAEMCPCNAQCTVLPPACMKCKTNYSCVYGKQVAFDCEVNPGVQCTDEKKRNQTRFTLNMTCQFCWQLPPSEYVCTNSTNCMTVSCPLKRYNATCTVLDNVHCIGNRVFPKMLPCNWTGGYKWSTALALRYVVD